MLDLQSREGRAAAGDLLTQPGCAARAPGPPILCDFEKDCIVSYWARRDDRLPFASASRPIHWLTLG